MAVLVNPDKDGKNTDGNFKNETEDILDTQKKNAYWL
jgi:hypothetical protein